MESTLSLLSVKHEQSHLASQKILDPIYFFALVDTKAVWFKKWMVRKNVFSLSFQGLALLSARGLC